MLKIIDRDNVASHARELEAAFRFRHEIFVEELGWEGVRRSDGLERDQFDDEHAVHFLLYGSNGLIGYQRLLPTTRPYLLSSVHPFLSDEALPNSTSTYEWTRFAVAKSHRGDSKGLGYAGARLVLAFVEWGLASGVNALVVELEPIQTLKFVQCHFRARPLGIAHPIGNVDIVAMIAEFDQRTRQRLLQLTELQVAA